MKKVLVLGLPLLLALSALPACGDDIPPYAANQNLVNTLGEEGAIDRLAKLIKGIAAPQVMAPSVEVDREAFHYQALDLPTPGVPYAGFGARGLVTKRIRFTDVEYTEVWESRGRWYVRLQGRSKALDKVRFESESDAKDFADVIMSLRANLAGPARRRVPAQ